MMLLLLLPLLLGAPLGACKLKIMAMRNKISPDRVQIPILPKFPASVHTYPKWIYWRLPSRSTRCVNWMNEWPHPTHPKLWLNVFSYGQNKIWHTHNSGYERGATSDIWTYVHMHVHTPKFLTRWAHISTLPHKHMQELDKMWVN